jgi:hypothetical protein
MFPEVARQHIAHNFIFVDDQNVATRGPAAPKPFICRAISEMTCHHLQ